MIRKIEGQAATTPLFGRDSTVEELSRPVRDLRTGRGGCVIVEGPPGIGKSRILDHVTDLARARGVAVAVGRATELDALLPLAALCGMFEELTASRPDPESGDAPAEPWPSGAGGAAPQGHLYALVEWVSAQITAWAASRPALIALDDAHWADEMTMLALRALVPATRSAPVLWLLTRRPNWPGCAQVGLDALVRQGARRHMLGPMPQEAIEQMCAHVLGAEPDASVRRFAARCDGNPFLLEELLTAARDSGRVQVREGRATLVEVGLPDDFVNAVDQHLATLPDQARRMLSAASVLGRPFSLHEVARLIGSALPELLPMATEAINAAILVSDGTRLAFRHELIREALYKGLPGAVRSALHREAAHLRQCEGASPVESIEHLIRSGHLDTDNALELLRQAVVETASNAPNTAADMIIRALAVIGDHEITQTPFVADAVRLLAEAGRFSEATKLAESRLRGNLSPADEALLLLRMSETLYLSGRHIAVVQMTEHALATPPPSGEVHSDLLGIRSLALLEAGAFAEADRASKLALKLGKGQPYPTQACSRAVRSQVALAKGDLDHALTFAHQAVQVADELRGEALNRHPRLTLCQALTAADRFAEAESVADRGLRDAGDHGAWAQPYYQLLTAKLRMAAGRIDEAREESLAGLRDAEQTGASRPMVKLLAVLARLAIHGGQLDQAADYLNRLDQLLATADDGRRDEVSVARIEYYQARDQLGEAYDAVAALCSSLPRWPSLLVHEPGAAVQLAVLAQRVGRPDQARLVAETADALADKNPGSASLTGVAAHVAGLLQGDLAQLRRAVQRLRHSPRPILRAAAVEDLARAESRAKRHTTAAELMREASELYRSCGSRLGHARSESQLSQLRAAASSWSPRPMVVTAPSSPLKCASAHTAWDSLTESERRVVRLVAQGLTNRKVAERLYLSPHTVDSHLRRSFAKLGVSNRTELARQVMTHDMEAHEVT